MLIPAENPPVKRRSEPLQFRVEWQIGQQVVPAKGTVAVSERLSPQPWCENRCAGLWEYELRIDSQDVPLQSQLAVTIETEEARD